MKNTETGFSIKIAAPEVREFIVASQLKMARETEGIELHRETVVLGVQFIFDHPERGFYVVALDSSGLPVGVLLILKEWSDWRNGDVWWMHSVYVIVKYRGQKVFSEMFRFVENMAQTENVRGLRLYVDKTNVVAQKVYQKLGMNGEHYQLFEKMF